MEQISSQIIKSLNSINIYDLPRISNESEFEEYIYDRLDAILEKGITLMTQSRTYSQGREIRPDIVIGKDDILIELKYDLKGVNDIYRLYYQAVRYSKRANFLLILCVHDPNQELRRNEIADLESIEKVKVIQLY